MSSTIPSFSLVVSGNSSESTVLQHIEPHLRDTKVVQRITDPRADYTKTLDVEWNVTLDHVV